MRVAGGTKCRAKTGVLETATVAGGTRINEQVRRP